MLDFIKRILLKKDDLPMIYDISFTELFLNKSNKSYEGSADIEGTNIMFNLVVKTLNVEELAPFIQSIYKKLIQIDKDARVIAYLEYSDLHSEYVGNKNPKLSESDFNLKTELGSITIEKDKHFVLRYLTGEFFSGLNIEMRYSKDFTLQNVGFEP